MRKGSRRALLASWISHCLRALPSSQSMHSRVSVEVGGARFTRLGYSSLQIRARCLYALSMTSTMLPVQAMGLFGFRKPVLPQRRLGRVAFSRVPRVRHLVRAERAPEQRDTQQDKVPEWVSLAVKDYDETVKKAQQACLDQQREVDK